MSYVFGTFGTIGLMIIIVFISGHSVSPAMPKSKVCALIITHGSCITHSLLYSGGSKKFCQKCRYSNYVYGISHVCTSFCVHVCIQSSDPRRASGLQVPDRPSSPLQLQWVQVSQSVIEPLNSFITSLYKCQVKYHANCMTVCIFSLSFRLQ